MPLPRVGHPPSAGHAHPRLPGAAPAEPRPLQTPSLPDNQHRPTHTLGLVACPLPLGEMAHLVAQLGCDRGLHQHVPLRVQSVPVVGGVNVLVDTTV